MSKSSTKSDSYSTELLSIKMPVSTETPLTEKSTQYHTSIKTQSINNSVRKGGDTKDNAPPKPLPPIPPNNKTVKSDVNDILKNINDHLTKLNLEGTKTIQNNDTLTIGDNRINKMCLLHFFSNNPKFLSTNKNQCSSVIQQYATDKTLDLTKLINLSSDKNWNMDTKFYENLYGFNVSVAEFIANSKEFKETDPKTQSTILSNFQQFIKQSLDYFGKYMKQYQIINDNLLNNSYNLLYLLNIMSFHQANVGTSISDLDGLYKKLVETINANIVLYESIDKTKIVGTTVNQQEIDMSKQISELKTKLDASLKKLSEQQSQLKKNVDEINKNAFSIENFATNDVKNISKAMKQLTKQ